MCGNAILTWSSAAAVILEIRLGFNPCADPSLEAQIGHLPLDRRHVDLLRARSFKCKPWGYVGQFVDVCELLMRFCAGFVNDSNFVYAVIEFEVGLDPRWKGMITVDMQLKVQILEGKC